MNNNFGKRKQLNICEVYSTYRISHTLQKLKSKYTHYRKYLNYFDLNFISYASDTLQV